MAQFILYSSSTSRYYMSVPEYFEEKNLKLLNCFVSSPAGCAVHMLQWVWPPEPPQSMFMGTSPS